MQEQVIPLPPPSEEGLVRQRLFFRPKHPDFWPLRCVSTHRSWSSGPQASSGGGDYVVPLSTQGCPRGLGRGLCKGPERTLCVVLGLPSKKGFACTERSDSGGAAFQRVVQSSGPERARAAALQRGVRRRRSENEASSEHGRLRRVTQSLSPCL
jgi:hypothetical protein